MQIIPLSEGSFTIGKDKIFEPFNPETDQLSDRSVGSLLVEVQPFCVVTRQDIIILDCGLGFTTENQPQIWQNLKKNGIQPQDVTKVLLSHLHKDHAGGVSYTDRLGNYQLSFENATYFVQRREYDFAEQTGYPGFIVDEFTVFDNHPKIFWLHEDQGIIDNYIRYQLTGGHSPYHQVFWIDEPNETVFFGGDEAPQYKQMQNRIVAKYDFDGRKSMELRQQWWQQGQQEHWTFLFFHDVENAIVKA